MLIIPAQFPFAKGVTEDSLSGPVGLGALAVGVKSQALAQEVRSRKLPTAPPLPEKE